MPQNKVGKSTSCTHCWKKWNLTSFYMLSLFQTIAANAAIEKKIFNDDALFEGAVCKDCRLTSCTVVYKRLRKSGSCHNVSRNVKSYVMHQTHCCSLKWPELNLYSSSYVFDINQVN